MPANYHNSAWFYDPLSKLVFGNAIVRSLVSLLPWLPVKGSVLIAGGGTGWILEEIAKLRPSDLQIDYVEVAEGMLRRAKKRNAGGNIVNFVHGPVEEFIPGRQFDTIITPFLFDNFREKNFRKISAHLDACLKPGGVWLNTDFQVSGRVWQYVLLGAMFVFFRSLCGIEGHRLPHISAQFLHFGYLKTDEQYLFGNFICSTAYLKPGNDADAENAQGS